MRTTRQQKQVAIWKVAWKLAFRQVQRASIWMNLLIILIMILTFLNLVVITGILTGLTVGLVQDNRQEYSGDIFISTFSGEDIITNSNAIRQTLASHPDVESFTERYIQQATIEANYQTRWDFDAPENSVTVPITGIDPSNENLVTKLSNSVVEGTYLNSTESGYILVGSDNLAQYTDFSDTFDPLANVEIGSRVKITYNNKSKDNEGGGGIGPNSVASNDAVDRTGVSAEFIVKGIVDTKVNDVKRRVFITDADWNRLVNQKVREADEFAVRLKAGSNQDEVAKDLRAAGFDEYGKIETALEALPSVLNNLQTTFGMLGNVIGGIAVMVSAITVFVIIYINALTKRKQIGILKGIGINGKAIKRAYVMQSLFFGLIGSVIGFIIVFTVLVPYFNANPIDFPFSDGILDASYFETFVRAVVLITVTAIAGYIPAWLIVRQNTLNSILNR